MVVVGFDKSSKSERMRSVALSEASGLLREIAGPRLAGESIKSVFRRLSDEIEDWAYGRVRAVWYSDPRVRVKSAEVEQLKLIAHRNAAQKVDVNDLDELRATVQRLAKYEALLQRIDADFFGPEVSATRSQAGQARGFLGKGGA
ncbi:hypothetical protein AB7714_28205 [Tardiphaga sp. 1201_B9_N1_1]|uniref:hypothetical protein n=1 Tax=unclassified Tardiphaga TaxID=2631404 RepID=UPI003F1ED715